MPDLNEMCTIEILSINQENPRVSGNQWKRKSNVTARKRDRLNGLIFHSMNDKVVLVFEAKTLKNRARFERF